MRKLSLLTILAFTGCIGGTLTDSGTASEAIATVTVTPGYQAIPPGGTAQFSTILKNADGAVVNGPVSWKSSAPTVASISDSGLVTGISQGSAVITATSDGHSATGVVSVAPPGAAAVATISITPSVGSVETGGTLKLTATPHDTNGNPLTGRAVSWSSSDLTIASVSATGLVTGIAAGQVVVTATSEGHSATVSVTVSSVTVASVVVTPATANIPVGTTVHLSALVRDESGRTLTGRVITWRSSQPGVASVSSDGVVTGVAVGGPVTITATSDGNSATASITISTVGGPVNSIWVFPQSLTLYTGTGLLTHSAQLSTLIEDSNFNVLTGRLVTWMSSDPSIVSVSSSGYVTAVAAGGPVTITATSEGKSSTTIVSVREPPPSIPDSTSVSVTVVTTGNDQDPDGYIVASPYFPGGGFVTGANTTTDLGKLRTTLGSFSVTLTDVDPNCTVDLPIQTVWLSGAPIHVTFNVSCLPRGMVEAGDPLIGVWRTVKYEFFNDSAFTSRFTDFMADGDVSTLILGPTIQGTAGWQWKDRVNGVYGEGGSVFAGTASVSGAIRETNSPFTLAQDMKYCCGNSPITGRESFVLNGDQLVISSLFPASLDGDYGSFPGWYRIVLVRVR